MGENLHIVESSSAPVTVTEAGSFVVSHLPQTIETRQDYEERVMKYSGTMRICQEVLGPWFCGYYKIPMVFIAFWDCTLRSKMQEKTQIISSESVSQLNGHGKNICFLNFSWLKRTIIDLKHIEACILQVTRGSVLARDSGSSPTFTLVNNWCWCPLLWFMFPLLVELSMGLREISQCPEVPLTALMSPLSVRKRFQCSRGRSATGHSIWASLPLGDFHVYFCLGN